MVLVAKRDQVSLDLVEEIGHLKNQLYLILLGLILTIKNIIIIKNIIAIKNITIIKNIIVIIKQVLYP